MAYEFDVDTAVEPAGDGVFTATITDRWNTFAGPNGGYILAIAARALAETLPKPHPLGITGHFLRPPVAGQLDIATEQVKAGKRHATGIARASQNGKELLVAVATFGDLAERTGRTLELDEPPKLPAPEDSIDPLEHFPAENLPSIAERMETRVAALPGWLQGKPSGDPSYQGWLRLRDGRPSDPLSLVYFVDAIVPTVFEISELVSSTVEMTIEVRNIPVSDWLAFDVRSRHIVGGYYEEDMNLWDAEGNLVAQGRQLALLAG
jgi:acyl-CoA thioesterase